MEEFYRGNTCKECHKRNVQEWRKTHPDACAGYQKKYRSSLHAKEQRQLQNWYGNAHKKFRMRVLYALSDGDPKCLRCKFSDWRALQVDHINGDGYKEFIRMKSPGNLYREILKNPDRTKYQILCANCNWIKRYERKEAGMPPKLLKERLEFEEWRKNKRIEAISCCIGQQGKSGLAVPEVNRKENGNLGY